MGYWIIKVDLVFNIPSFDDTYLSFWNSGVVNHQRILGINQFICYLFFIIPSKTIDNFGDILLAEVII